MSRGRARRSRRPRPRPPAAGVPDGRRRPERAGREQPGVILHGPPIAITCACGRRESVRYGTAWTCDRCGRTWDTTHIPREEYAAIRRITWRFRLLPIVLGLVVACLALLFLLTGNTGGVFVLLPLALIVWFTYLRTAHRRRYRQALANLPRWRL